MKMIYKYDLNESISARIENWCLENNIPVIGKIPFDEQIVEAMVQCKSIIEWVPQSEASNVIRSIYKAIFHE